MVSRTQCDWKKSTSRITDWLSTYRLRLAIHERKGDRRSSHQDIHTKRRYQTIFCFLDRKTLVAGLFTGSRSVRTIIERSRGRLPGPISYPSSSWNQRGLCHILPRERGRSYPVGGQSIPGKIVYHA